MKRQLTQGSVQLRKKQQVELSEDDIFNIQDRVEAKKNHFPPSPTWQQRSCVDVVFGPSESYTKGHFYAYFHTILKLPPINCEDERELERASNSATESLELWQIQGRVDLVYVLNGIRTIRVFLAKKAMYTPSASFPQTKDDKKFFMMGAEDTMGLDMLCLFMLQRIRELSSAM